MTVQTITIIANVWSAVLALVAIVFLWHYRRRSEVLIPILLLYVMLAFSHTLVFLFSSADVALWMPVLGGLLGPKLSATVVLLAFLLISFVWLIKNDHFETLAGFGIAIGLPATLFFIGIMLNLNIASQQWRLDVLTQLASIALVAVFCFLMVGGRTEIPSFIRPAVYILLLVTVAVSLYEICFGRAWALYLRNDGRLIARASGIFFNPNLQGGILGLLTLALLYDGSCSCARRRFNFLPFVLIGVGLFLTGSRSALVMLTAALIINCLSNWRDAHLLIRPITSMALGFGIIASAGLVIEASLPNLYILALRWIEFPVQVFYVIGRSWNFHLPIMFDSYISGDIRNFNISMTGRVVGGVSDISDISDIIDNGWRGILGSSGWFGLAGQIIVWMAAVVTFIKWSTARLGAERATAASLFAYFVVWSFHARTFQVYPIWLLQSLATALLFACAIRGRQAISRSEAALKRI